MSSYGDKYEKIYNDLVSGKKISEEDAITVLNKSFTLARSNKIYNGLKNSLGNKKFVEVMIERIQSLDKEISTRSQHKMFPEEEAVVKNFLDDQIQNLSDEDIKTLVNLNWLSRNINIHLIVKLFEIGKYNKYKKEIQSKYNSEGYAGSIYEAAKEIAKTSDFPQSRLPDVADEILEAYERFVENDPTAFLRPSSKTFYLESLYENYGKYFDKKKLSLIILKNFKILHPLTWMVDSTVMKNSFSNFSDEEKIEILNAYREAIIKDNIKINKGQILPILMLALRDRNQNISKLAKQTISILKT